MSQEKDFMEVQHAVYSTNEDIYNINNPLLKKEIENNGNLLDYHSDGDSIGIKFLGIQIWSQDDDTREWDEELDNYKESIYNFIKKEIKRIVSTISDIANME